jgi:hypothetical protein
VEIVGPCESSLTTRKAEEICEALGVPYAYKPPRRSDVVARLTFTVPDHFTEDQRQTLYDSLKVGEVLSGPIRLPGEGDTGPPGKSDNSDDGYGEPIPEAFALGEY